MRRGFPRFPLPRRRPAPPPRPALPARRRPTRKLDLGLDVNVDVDVHNHDDHSDHGQMYYPDNYLHIIKEASSDISPDDQLDHLQTGIFLDQNKKKYWVDENYCNSFMLFARNLSITWGDDKRYWAWPSMKDTTSDVHTEVAELLQVCWLEVRGKFNISNLSPETKYEVVFVVKLTQEAHGWEYPVILKLVTPSGNTQEHKVTLQNKPHGDWIELFVGDFQTCNNDKGELQFALLGSEGLWWKGGLLIKGVNIRPKKY